MPVAKTVNITLDQLRSYATVVPGTGCWYMTKTGGSNPSLRVGGHKIRLRRLAYSMVPGRPPLGDMTVRSTCNDPRCFNPKHMKIGDCRVAPRPAEPTCVGNRRYPWVEWFALPEFVLSRDDYAGATHGMVQQIRSRAPSYGKRVSVQVRGDDIHVTVTDRPRR